MVRTRHSGDGEEECSPKFLSLRNERNRHGIKSTEGKEDGQHPTLSYRGGRHAYNVFEDKVVESRLRPRVGPSHAYNYLDADSSDDDSYRHSRRQPMHEMMSSRRRSRYSRSHDIKQELLEEHQVRSERRQRRRMSAPAEESQDHSVTDDDDEHTESMRRKSSRTKRQIYNKLNQSYLVSPPAQEKDVDEHMDQSDLKDQDSEDNQQFSDMYSRVKRKRVQVKRNMYGVPINDDSDSEQGDDKERNRNDNSKDDEEEEGDDDDEREEGEENGDNSVGSRRSSKRLSGGKREREQPVVKQYSLREHKPRTDLYKAPVEERKIRRTDHSIFASTPTKKSTNQTYQSPAQRRNKRKRSAFHSDSSSTSSSDSESSDEKKFKHRKNKSMAKARSRLMPMNFSSNALPPAGVIKDRVKSGASLADVEPMNIDRNVTFNSIGGLGKHIRALKEMVVFPLLYDKVFQRFKVDPPRGVLFYGPPGTGKTLVARALANECSHGDRKVAFFMRKGADCLSKWVGESERQLRLLFDQAYKFRPSIIFFDEIDGLAPVRSSRQDQIHSSIVSTLLALMDGLDSRGEIVVIGATNRIDSLDPALRRPGRFDREFLFPLPSLEARTQILKIHTACWTPKLNDHFISQLAEKCVGYCGADLKALCTEAAMLALRRRYPQIYISNEALQLDESSIKVSAKDFFDAVQNIIPTSQRAVNTPARALSARVCPLLQRQLDRVMSQLADTFPPCLAQISSLDAAATSSQAQALAENGAIWDELASDEEEGAPSIFVTTPTSKGSKAAKKHSDEGTSNSETVPTYLNFISYATSRPATFRPRMLLVGCEGQGQTTYIAPAVVHKMESLPVHVLDLPALYAVTAKTPEESCANVFHEAKRKCPSIVYLPYINQWWEVMAETLRATLLTLIHNLDPTLPLLLLATSEQPYHTLDPMLQSMFNKYSGEVVTMSNPNSEERKVFFQDLVMRQASRPPPQKKQADEIVKLLENSKKAKTCNFLPSNHKRLRAKRNRKMSSPLPNYVYPFGAENVLETCSVGDRAETKSPRCVKKIWPNSRPPPADKDMSEGRWQWSKRKSCRRTPGQCSLVKASPASTHGMTLRSRVNIQRLNSNQSARGRGWRCHSVVYTSHKSAVPSKQRGAFKEPVALSRGAQSSKSCTSHRVWSLSDRHKRYLRRLHKLEEKLAEVGPSHTHECFDPQYRNSHCSLTSRHQRYVRRLEKLQRPLGVWAQAGNRCILPSSHMSVRSAKSSHHSSVFSCGSFQMLYKTEEGDHDYGELSDGDSVLPVNLRDLCPDRLQDAPHSSKQWTRLHSGLHKNRCCKTKRVKTEPTDSLVSKRHPRYNLRLQTWLHPGAQRMLEVLPKAVANKPRELNKEELKQLMEKEELTLMELRIFLRDVLNKLGGDKKFSIFAKPVDIDDAPDYYEVIEQPMDLSTMMSKIDLHEYGTVSAFMKDIDLVCSNALEYNPNRGPMDRVIRHRACALKDTAYAIIRTELDKDFEKMCMEIEESRKRRGQKSLDVPNFYYTKPVNQQGSSRAQQSGSLPSYLENPKPVRTIHKPEGERYSRRVRGLNIDPTPALESVEKVYRAARSGSSPTRDNKNNSSGGTELEGNTPGQSLETEVDKAVGESNVSKDVKPNPAPKKSHISSGSSKSQPSSANPKRSRTTKCVWCKPKRKRPRLMFSRHPLRRKSMEEETEVDLSQGEEDSRVTEAATPTGRPSATTVTPCSTTTTTTVTPCSTTTTTTVTPCSTTTTTAVEQQLSIEVSEHSSESKELKSPQRVSSRLRSPVLGNPVGVTTRRSSMSPRGAGSVVGSPTTSGAVEASLVEEEEEEVVDTLATPVQEETNSSAQALLSSSQNKASQEREPLVLPSTSVSPVCGEKRSVVKRLDLEAVTVDSGVGSSVDSNGDSRDSLEHSSKEAPCKTPETQEINDTNQNCNAELKLRANAILQESPQKLVVDTQRLQALLQRLVTRTEGFTVEGLEKLYSHLSQVIYRHRHEYNRTTMILNLEKKAEELTRPVPSTSSSLGHSSASAYC
ncbi:ATPase family AAA domain-containing protein 2 isoform X2 [Aplysia californica]|uniref:ATPase family AAA domain-containing protein 2 isoform X2 n=1 Tax=Aplysia californica TaxID=6500 RepID=A0ABM1W176_APLCA|nr:ATPase family AAA domain-containing protein 2 isoform X2 [Aplysia californica]